MAAAHRMTRKGQVTIPVETRRKLGLKPGDLVRFVESGDRVFMEAAGKSEAEQIEEFDRWLDSIVGSVDFGGKTTDEILDEIRPQRLDPI